jgi:hypothetical protein
MMAGHPNPFEGDQRRGHATFPVAKDLAAELVSPAEGKCYPKGDADGRGSATTDLSQTLPQLRQTDILTTHQVALPGASGLKRQYMRPGNILHRHYVQSTT